MQDRIKEIRDRVDKATDWREGREDLINNACEDIEYLLAALEEAQEEMENMERIGTDVCADLKQSQDRERVLQEENKRLLDERQSVDVYRDQFIKILQKNTGMQDRERVLRDALGILVDKYVANRGTEHQFISCITPTVMPDYWINAMEALGQDGK
jgi:chromosome segregation ATPase